MTKKRTVTVSIRLLPEVCDEIEEYKRPGGYASFSAAVSGCAELGLQVHKYQDMMKDPEKRDEFIEKMKELVHDGRIDEIIEPMTEEQLHGTIMRCKMKLDSRYEQRLVM